MSGDSENKKRDSEVTLPSRATAAESSEQRLDSWKEIAVYLDRDVTTVQRWEKREGMPVHRHLHDQKGSVYAFRAELDAWSRSRSPAIANAVATAGFRDAPPPKHRSRWQTIALLTLAAVIFGAASVVWLQSPQAWQNPIANARFQPLTEWEGVEKAAAISRDGRFVAFLSDRDGQMDVWITQPGSGHFYNLTKGRVTELVNPSIRTLGFSPDGSLVTFWVRKLKSGKENEISVWAVPTLGGEPRPFLDGVAEYDWSPDGSSLVYHTPGPGDPMFISSGMPQLGGKPIFTAPAGLHSHFPVWSPDGAFIYFVQGTLPDKLDIWRIAVKGGSPERITSHNALVSHPVLLDRNTLLYLATDSAGSGPWLYGLDIARRIPERLASGIDRYTSLSASADGRRLAITAAGLARSLWRLKLKGEKETVSLPARIPLTAATGFSPRLGLDYLVFVSADGATESLWRAQLHDNTNTELWHGEDARIIGGPAISADGKHIAFSARQHARTLLYTVGSDGADARIVSDSLDLRGEPAWEPSGMAITIAAMDAGSPRLFRVPLDGGVPTRLTHDYGLNPAWAHSGGFAVYSGPDIGTMFAVKAVTTNGADYLLPSVILTRGSRRFVFSKNDRSIVVLRGDMQHKDLWLVDLATGAQRQLTRLPPDFDVRDFDVSADGSEIVLERAQDRSDIALLELQLR